MCNCESHRKKSDRIGWDGDQKFSLVLPAALTSGEKNTEDGDKGDGSTAGLDDFGVKKCFTMLEICGFKPLIMARRIVGIWHDQTGGLAQGHGRVARLGIVHVPH